MPFVSALPVAFWSLVGLFAAMSVTGPIDTVTDRRAGDGPRHRVVDVGDRVNTRARIAIDLRGTASADVLFAPVELAVGESYSMDWRTESGESLGRFDLYQTSRTKTRLGFYLGDRWQADEPAKPRTDERTIRIAAMVGNETLHAYTVTPMSSYVHVGVVTSPGGAWAATWHYVCHGDTCSLRIDPEDTSIEFRGQDMGAVPFEIVAVDVEDPGVRGGELLMGQLW